MIKSHTDNPMNPFTDQQQIEEIYTPTDEDWQAVYDDDQELEMYSLECAFGPEE